LEDTIVALSTPPGRGGVSVVRVSGALSKKIGASLCGALADSNELRPCVIRNGEKERIDFGLVVFFKGPKSYTGEDMTEINCHGNPLVVDSIIKACCFFGARLAEPGEFTKRAFMNEKIDLAQAESVADLISAQTSSAVVAANSSLRGDFSKCINNSIDEMIRVRVLVEALLDFSDEDSVLLIEEKQAEIFKGVCLVRDALSALIERGEFGNKMIEGLRVAFVGPPNCGKSTLLNLIAKEEVAITSASPGTTRDPVRARVDVRGIPVEFVDTAGIRGGVSEHIEVEGMSRAVETLGLSDVVVVMSEVGEDFDISVPQDAVSLRVFNKIDLCSEGPDQRGGGFYVSAKTGEGVDVFLDRIVSYSPGPPETPLVARRRHLESLGEAVKCLEKGTANLKGKVSLEVVAEDLRRAQVALGNITRPTSADDLLGSIFSEFCIGK
tara:strand:+ start:899 stop:2215 length:1317 start_codon:yes stop_codon:yes gene_type:complete